MLGCVDNGALLPIDCARIVPRMSGFGSGHGKYAPGLVLCPALRKIQNASCATLESPEAVAEILAPVVREPFCCKLGWVGLKGAGMSRDAHVSHDLALMLLKLGRTLEDDRVVRGLPVLARRTSQVVAPVFALPSILLLGPLFVACAACDVAYTRVRILLSGAQNA